MRARSLRFVSSSTVQRPTPRSSRTFNAAGARASSTRITTGRSRVGFDPHPLDIRFDDDVTWLRACIWPGDRERLDRFDVAAAAMRAAYTEDASPPVVQTLHAGLAPSRLESLSKNLPDDVLV